jgi:hypothetical protein
VDPEVFKAENLGLRDGSGDSDFEGNVIRGGPGKGREHGVRQNLVPTEVDEDPIKPFQGRVGPPVRPGKPPIQQGKYDEAHGIYTLIESFSFSKTEIAIVFLVRVPYHVEVATEQPRDISRGSNRLQLSKELGPVFRNRGSVNVGDNEGEIGNGGGKVDRQGVSGGGSIERGEKGVRPGSKDAAGSTVRWRVVKAVKSTGKEAI